MSAAYKRSLFYFLLGLANSIATEKLRYDNDREIVAVLQVLVVMSSFLMSVTNLCCLDILIEGWFLTLDAIIFSSLWTICILLLNEAMQGFVFVFCISCASAIFHSIVKYSTRPKLDPMIDNTVSFSNTSMGAADFVFQDERANEEKDFVVDTILEGFRVRMDKLPEKKHPGELVGDGQPLVWGDFHSVQHLIDSSSCHIYIAYWNTRKVVLKLIKAERVNSAVAVSEFETEVSVLSRLNHGNVVRFLGSGHQPRRFIVLEFLEGGTLAAALGMNYLDPKKPTEKRKFTFLQSLSLARALANAMGYLHKEWHDSVIIVHRDLKPDNIGFTANGILKVFDFGLCACIKATPSQEPENSKYDMTGNTGTLRYMAPEVALGEQYNQSVDVYSFGIITWQVLKGKVPFEEMNKKIFFEKVVRGKYRPVLDRLWPKKLCGLLESCWNDDYRRRPSFPEVLEKLDEIIEDNKNYLSCFSMSFGIPVNFSSGIICIDPEFVAKHRHIFIFCHVILFLMGIFLTSIRVFVWGVFIVNLSLFSLYICVYMSWEYWPSSGKGSKSIRWLLSCFRSYEALDRDASLSNSIDKADTGFSNLSPRNSSSSMNPILHQGGGGISLMSKRTAKDSNTLSPRGGATFSAVSVEV